MMSNEKKSPKQKNNWTRLFTVFSTYIAIAIVLALAISYFSGGFSTNGNNEEMVLSTVIEEVKAGNVEKIEVNDDDLTVTLTNGSVVESRKETGVSMYEILSQSGIENPSEAVSIDIASPMFGEIFTSIVSNLLPIVIMIIFFLFIFRQAGRSSGGMLDFGKSKAKLFSKDQPKVTFSDAAGVAEAKRELEEVVDFLKRPEKYRKLGARIPKGILLVGPAGTGKTLLARAVATEAKVPFLSMAGSEFMEMLVGVGASRVRDLFQQAKASAPALIFIDEIESIGRQRGRSVMSSHGEQEQTLNQILVEMDGFTPSDNVIILAATNRPDLLDPALMRPGRFDRRVMLQLPDLEGRKEIIKIHIKNKPVDETVDMDRIARMTVGFSGADIENLLNESAILAASNDKDKVSMKDINESVTKVKLGRERRHFQTDQDKKITAYHESGHALVAKLIPGMDPVERISIISRGMALGFTEMNPQEDRSHQTKTDLEGRLAALLGGRAAEEIVYNDMTVGAKKDLEQTARIAYKMVTEFGMSDLGPIAYEYLDDTDSMGSDLMARQKRYSDKTAAEIDNQIDKLIKGAYGKAKSILEDNRDLLEKVVEVLLEEETIEKDRFDALVADHVKA